MKSDTRDKPRVAILTAGGEDLPPGLEPLHDKAEVAHADDRESLESALSGARVLMVTDFNTDLLEQAWPKADKLEWVHATIAGVDAVLFPDIIESGVTVTNARGIFNEAIAEYVLGLILAFSKY
jgi:phosphoglycerate dehydrogenase-like enzyme